MASTNIGNLNVRLTLTADQFAAAMQTAGGQVRVFAKNVQAQAEQTQIASNSLFHFSSRAQHFGMLLPALAQGIADASSQFGTRGLGGALQAAANNIQVMGAAFGPLGLAISSTLGLGVQLTGAYIEAQDRLAKKSKESSDSTTKDVKRQSDALAELRDRLNEIRSAAEFQFEARGGFGNATAEALRNRIAGLDQRRAGATAQRQGILEAIAPEIEKFIGFRTNAEDARKILERAGKAGRSLSQELSDQMFGPAGPQSDKDRQRLADFSERITPFVKQFNDVQRELITNQQQRQELTKAQVEAQAAEDRRRADAAELADANQRDQLQDQFRKQFSAAEIAKDVQDASRAQRGGFAGVEAAKEQLRADEELLREVTGRGIIPQDELSKAEQSLQARADALGIERATTVDSKDQDAIRKNTEKTAADGDVMIELLRRGNAIQQEQARPIVVERF